jgi:hypothetical protein
MTFLQLIGAASDEKYSQAQKVLDEIDKINS